MVQVLPYVPSFGEKLANAFGEAGGAVGSAYMKNREKQKALKALEQFSNQGSSMPGSQLGELDEMADQEINPMQAVKYYELINKAYGPKEAELAANAYIENQKHKRNLRDEQRVAQVKKEEAAEKEKADQQGIVQSLDRLEELIPQTGKTFGEVTGLNKIFDRQQIQDREEFDKTGLLVGDYIYTHFNKGTVSNAKLELIKNDFSPRADLSERENKGRILAIRRILNLPKDASEAEVNKVIAKEKKEIKKEESKSERPSLESFYQ